MRVGFHPAAWLLVSAILISVANTARSEPLFPNSVVSNDLEFIRTDDESAFSCLVFDGTQRAEMPDKRSDELFADGVYIFNANYTDGTVVDLWAHPDLGSQEAALESVEPVAQAIGKLPTIMRSKIRHVVVHKGDETAFGEDRGGFFVLYSENIKTRIRNHDLEETVFHETVHATLDFKYHHRSGKWKKAQQADGGFVTEYAADLPDKEDLAESASFAWAMLVHPGRLPRDIEQRVRGIMPNRLAFFEDLFLSKPIFHSKGRERKC